MDLQDLREYCLRKKGVSEDTPFDETTLVFRVGNKIFALTDIEDIPLSVNLKCDPERAIDLRERYECIIPGYHMNKKHWNTIELNSCIDDNFVRELIDHSYDLIFNSLKKAERERILGG
jgi:predicted DNA-binding protein (MmcQ/YjbR family)